MTRLALSLFVASTLALAGCHKPKPASTTSTQPEATPAASTSSDSPATASNDSAAPGNNNGGAPGPGGGQRMTPEQRIAQMKTNLGLTDDQATKVAAVYEARRPAMEALRNDQSLSREQRREKMDELRKQSDQELSAILTPDQMAKLEAERAQMRERFASRQGGGQNGNGNQGGNREGGRRNRQGGNTPGGAPSQAPNTNN